MLSWLAAGFWQGPRYSAVAHTISDMYAVGAPHGLFLVVVLTLCGAATVAFVVLALGPALRPAGWTGVVGPVLLALSIYGLGDLLSPFEREGCRLADPGCTAAGQATGGGAVDALLSTVGLLVYLPAGLVLAAACRRVAGWEPLARPLRLVTVGVFVLLVATGASGAFGVEGLLERVLALVGAGGIALLAYRAGRPPEPLRTADAAG